MKCNWCQNETVEGITLCQACRERQAINSKKYIAKNKEKIAVRVKLYYEANKEAQVVRAKLYYKANKEKITVQNKLYREENKKKRSAQNKNYRKNNPDKTYAVARNRRARKRDAFVAPVNRKEIFERDGYVCQLCGLGVVPIVHSTHPLYPVIDHINPLSRGGTHEPSNVQTAHYGCNSSKSDRPDKHSTYSIPYC